MAFDADTDDDGIPDGEEDVNYNGVVDAGETDPCHPDSDLDGLQDGTEMGFTSEDVGSDTDLSVFQPDLDPDTFTDPLNTDTDGDGRPDGEEDVNHNGRVDVGENDPNIFDAGIVSCITLLLLSEGLPEERSRLNVWYEPNPVPVYTGDAPCYSVTEWQYRARIAEEAGVGLTIERFTWDFYDENGAFLGQSESSSTDFADWFDACGAGTAEIAGGSVVCGDLCAKLGSSHPSGSIVMTFYGTDDNQNPVSQAARVYFNASGTTITNLGEKTMD
jgi:hypothetical protein